MAFSLEAPNSAIDTGKISDVDPALGAGITGWNRLPDLVGVVRAWTATGATCKAAGILRQVGFQNTLTPDSNPSGHEDRLRPEPERHVQGVRQGPDQLAGRRRQGDRQLHERRRRRPRAGRQACSAETVHVARLAGLLQPRLDRQVDAAPSASAQHQQNNTDGQLGTAFRRGSYGNVNLLYTLAKNVLTGARVRLGRARDRRDGASADRLPLAVLDQGHVLIDRTAQSSARGATMQFKASFPILIAHREWRRRSVAGVRLRQIQHELERAGWKTIVVDNERRCRHRRRRAPRAGGDRVPRRGGARRCRRAQAAGRPDEARCTSARPGCRSSRSARARRSRADRADGHRGAAQPAQHPLPVRGHGAVPGAADHARRRGLSRQPAAAVLQGADAPRRALGVLVAHARACRRRRLPEVAGRLRAARLLRREHAALGPVDLGARTRLAARPHRAGQGGRGLRGAGVRRRPHLLRDQRHLDRQQDRLALDGRARRPGDRRPQLPQVAAALADHDRRDADLLHAGAQRLRHHRADRAGPVLARGDQEEDRRQPDRARRQGQRAHRRGHQLDLRRPLLQRREDQGRRSPTRSTRCTSTRPGTPTPRSTSSTPAATRWACRAAIRAPTTRWCSRRTRRTSCWPRSRRRR